MGGNSLKYFPMKGLAHEEEYRAVAKACAEEGFALEPTGGIDKENFETIVRIALEANVEQVIPHVYSSIIDKETGNTKVEDVRELLAVVKKLVINMRKKIAAFGEVMMRLQVPGYELLSQANTLNYSFLVQV